MLSYVMLLVCNRNVTTRESSGRMVLLLFFFQAEDGIRDLVRSRGLGDVYKRQGIQSVVAPKAGCCGAVKFHLNDQDGGMDEMRANLSLIHI